MRVLIVDDDEQILRATAMALRRSGWDVTTANDGLPAIAFTELFDVVIADFNLKSHVTGADVVRHFKALHGAATVCFVLSGEDDTDIRKSCLAAGARDVLLKPVSAMELRRHISDAAKTLQEKAA